MYDVDWPGVKTASPSPLPLPFRMGEGDPFDAGGSNPITSWSFKIFSLEFTGAPRTSKWFAVPTTPQSGGGAQKVAVEPAGAAQFYRLRK